jgi:hypothetical protein
LRVISYGAWSRADNAGGGGVQDTAAGRHVSGRRQRERQEDATSGNKTLVVEFRNGQDDWGGDSSFSLVLFLDFPAMIWYDFYCCRKSRNLLIASFLVRACSSITAWISESVLFGVHPNYINFLLSPKVFKLSPLGPSTIFVPCHMSPRKAAMDAVLSTLIKFTVWIASAAAERSASACAALSLTDYPFTVYHPLSNL